MYGRKFIIYTDHKPLTKILGPKHGIPSLAAARLQRWALILAAYDYISQQMITGMQTDYHDYQWMQKIEKGKNNIKHKANTTVVAAVVKRETQLDIVSTKIYKRRLARS